MRLKLLLTTAVLLVLGTAMATAQVTTGTISGTVTDSSGAVLPGAKVTITNEGTGLTRDTVTDGKGHYSAPTLPIGNYKIEGSMQGFENEVRTGVELTVGREAAVDMKLQVGAVSQSVEVTGEAPLVQTTEATVSYLVADQTMRDLPLNDRDMSQLVLLNPGVTETETLGAQAYNGYGRRLSISGARGEDNTYLMDGGMIGDFRRHIPAGPSGALLGVESTQEFQVLTNSYSAQYGRSLGGVFNAVSKSGTNQFHGDVYDFLRNQVLDANSWQNNIITPSSKDVNPPLRRNQFGATLGGPIKKDKIFFFGSYEGTRERLGFLESNTTFDDNARQGIFPAAQGGNVSVISPLMQPYLQWYPFATPGATNNGDGTQAYVWNYSQPTNEDYGQGRIDVPTITNNDSAFFRFTKSDSTRSVSTGFPGYLQTSSLGSTLTTLSETHIFSPTLLSSVRFHFNRVVPLDQGEEPGVCANAADAGTGCTPIGVQFAPGSPFSPLITPSTVTAIGGGGFPTSPTIMISNRFTFQDDITWTKGSHSIQIGGQLERFQDNSTKPNRYTGTWNWGSLQSFLSGTCNNLGTNAVAIAVPTCTANPNSPSLTTESAYRGAPVATALETVPSVIAAIGGTIPNGFDSYNRAFRQWTVGLYIQDAWRATKGLTLNLGIRYEPYTVPYEIHNELAELTSVFNNSVATIGNPYWQGSSKKDFSPRLGFAWDPFGTGKTSVRGGGGLLFEPNDPNLYYNAADRMPPLSFDFSITGNGHFPNVLNEIAAQPTLGPAFTVAPSNRSPHILQYNFSIQQQLGANDLFSIGYAGSRGFDLVGLAQDNTPFAVYDGQSLAIPTSTVNAVAGTGTINSNYSDVNVFQTAYSSWYNSLQATYARRFAKGLQTQVAYTFQKNESNSDSAQTANAVNLGGGSTAGVYTWDPNVQKGLSGYDIKNTLKVNYSYDLPTAKMFSKGVIGKVLGGWQTTGVITMHSGHPNTVTVSVPNALSNLRVLARDPNNNSAFTGPLYLGTPNDSSTQLFCPTGFSAGSSSCFYPYFNINQYVAAPCVPSNGAGTPPQVSNPSGVGVIGANCLGTYELGNVGRDTLISPGEITWDPGLFKSFTLTEKTKLQFRLEMFNALNRPNFSAPAASLVGATGIPSTTAGKISTTVGTPRNIQLALKLTW